ncbi:MAG: OmpA family protein [Phycisphaerales bacterium]|nr:OmpA family protein [Phycisphaerales bacterium]
MNKRIVCTGLFGLLAAAALGLGGCTNTLKEENAQLRENNAKLETERADLVKTSAAEQAARAEAEGKAAAKEGEIARLQQELAARQAQPPAGPGPSAPYRTGGSTRTILAGDVLFGPGSATLTSGGKKEVDKVIADFKRQHAGDSIVVEGYTDSDPIKKSSFGSNRALSQARAEAVEKYMISKGVSSSRISAVGKGSESPKGTKAASRRVEIVIVDR